MNKVKSLVKRLIGRPASTPSLINIDICSKTVNGYVVIGWYLSEKVNSLTLVDNASSDLESNTTKIAREDVVAHIGQPADGFQITVDTDLDIDDIKLLAKLADGSTQKIALMLKNAQQFIAPRVPVSEEQVISPSDTEARASCEFVIIAEKHIFVSGWIVDKTSHVDAVLVNSKGKVVGNTVHQLRCNRKDVQDVFGVGTKVNTGIILSLERTDTKKYLARELTLRVHLDSSTEQDVDVQNLYHTDTNPIATLRRLLTHWTAHDALHLSKSVIFRPFLSELYPKDRKVEVRRVDFSGRIEHPRVSIVIPLYGRYDFLRYQMSHFDRYSEYHDVEIIYVVDDPNISSAVGTLARRLTHSTRHPFSVLYLSENVGFGKANNLGVEYTASDNLVLLNSDVLPRDAEWLNKMLTLVEKENVGIVGARLLFEDDTIQHNGMAPMTVAEYPGLYFNDHPKKGWPKNFAEQDGGEQKCDLLTAACWAIKKTVFEQVGGFDPTYILGDFEDSDLCLAILASGRVNYLHRDAELYHLERQSQNLVDSGGWKHNVTILNAITFNERWRSELEILAGVGADSNE
ncbi:glycosyltransferase family 2 protein [Alteromonas oceanisediminis]|uniref:glycosyltransferase family 2 protein n=1 Tax=Alteromonas oceanisediminis TaxID=2836180 RepID=UPI001BDAE239|nr:glycosyltransferase family 2 protein [Alteromonas oceanisediminis]MBT0585036.1 glycosyltransferase family 2 protein [Alteromonas oceanisediminis]